jgi:hypothetical protein
MMRSSALLVLALLTSTSAWGAEEPSGCDKFKWNIDHARAALTAPDRTKLASGGELGAMPSTGVTIALVAPADAKLPIPPERGPKDGTFAGFAKFPAAPKAGSYTISLSNGAWIDLVQDGHFLKPTAFNGATDCEGIRKTVKFDLSARPFVFQISSVRQNSISLVVQPSE